jgi:hypothetical protein
MTAELDRVRPGESSRRGASLKVKEVATKAGKRLRFEKAVGCFSAKQARYILEVKARDVDCGHTSVVAMRCVMAWPGVAW